MATSGQTLNDRINAARYALAGQGLARCVCKATTEEVIGPKKKHLDYLLACTHEPNVSIPQLANLLIERTNHIYWVVVFKALVTVHHLMSYGNERFIQYLASSNYSFELSTFLDKTATRDFSMSTFIRRYSRYINEKALSYRLLAFDFCKVKRGNEGVLRVMPIDRLIKTLPILQNQLDALLEFDCAANDLNNGVINACFMLLFRDLIGLFACHNDGIINLLNKYFSLNRKMCREAFDLYKKFLVRMDKVSDFLRVAEVVGIDKDEIPDLRRAPSSLIDALEQHLQNIDSNKKLNKQQSGSNKSGNELGNVIGNLTPPSSGRSHSPNSTSTPTNSSISTQNDELQVGSTFRDDEVRKALEEEARVLSQYGSDGIKTKSKDNSGQGSPNLVTNDGESLKFAVTATVPKTIDDIFGDANTFSSGRDKARESNGSAFDNLSTTSSSTSGGLKNKLELKVDTDPIKSVNKSGTTIDSIKSTIKTATTTLEKSSAKGGHDTTTATSTTTSSKKASDDLFNLLEAIPPVREQNLNSASQGSVLFGTTQAKSTPNTTPFSTASPFDVPSTNGGQSALLKPSNPFPTAAIDFDLDFNSGFNTSKPPNIVPIQPNIDTVFKSSNPPAVNYTNLGKYRTYIQTGNRRLKQDINLLFAHSILGGLDNFGDLLQPTSSMNKGSGNSSTNNNTALGKSSFNSNSGLTSTGLFKGDLDTTLANLAQNLTFEGMSKTKK